MGGILRAAAPEAFVTPYDGRSGVCSEPPRHARPVTRRRSAPSRMGRPPQRGRPLERACRRQHLCGHTRTRMHSISSSGATTTASARSRPQQYADPDGRRDGRASVRRSGALFGQLWPADGILAGAMAVFDIAGNSILEVGCGMGLASLVLQRRRRGHPRRDHHPLAEVFLRDKRRTQWSAGSLSRPAVGDRRRAAGSVRSDHRHEYCTKRQHVPLLAPCWGGMPARGGDHDHRPGSRIRHS